MAAAACAGPSADPTSTTMATPTTLAATTTTEVERTTTSSVTTTSSPPPPTIDVIAGDYLYQGVPETVPLGTRLVLVNDSETEFHELAIGFMGDDMTPIEEMAMLNDPRSIASQYAPLRTVLFARPGEVYYDQITGPGYGPPDLNRPGRWVLFCSIPVGTDPQDAVAQVATGNPMVLPPDTQRHYQVGMFIEVFVEG